MKTQKVEIIGFESQSEIKDPSILQMPDGTFKMWASVGNSEDQIWGMGVFEARHPAGPWLMTDTVEIHGLVNGPGIELRQLCAPAITYDGTTGQFHMYVQTGCFIEGSYIAELVSDDGVHFYDVPENAYRTDHVRAPHPIVSLYDVSVTSGISFNHKTRELMTLSAYRHVGCGDIYVAARDQNTNGHWSDARPVLMQEDMHFHNMPGSPTFEWGLEGARIVQLKPHMFMMIGVCFLDQHNPVPGTRQRVFLAAAKSPFGPYKAVDLPFKPTHYPDGTGENGHPDLIDFGTSLGILYQERSGNHKPWHLRYGEMPKKDLINCLAPPLADRHGNRAKDVLAFI